MYFRLKSLRVLRKRDLNYCVTAKMFLSQANALNKCYSNIHVIKDLREAVSAK